LNHQYKDIPLKQEIEVAIVAAVRDPILHIKFVDETFDHRPKNGERFCFGEQFLFVLCLNLAAFVNGQFNYTKC